MLRNRHRGRAKKHYVKRSFLDKLIGSQTTPSESEDYDVQTEDEIWTLNWGNKKATTAVRPVVTNQFRGPDVGGLMSEKVGVKTPASWRFNVGMTSSTHRALIEGIVPYSPVVFNFPKATTNAATPLMEGIVAYSPPMFIPLATTTQAPGGLMEGIVAYSPPGKFPFATTTVLQPVAGAAEEVTGATEGTVEESTEVTSEAPTTEATIPSTEEKTTELTVASTEEQTSEVVSTTEATVAPSTEQTVASTEEPTSKVVSTTEATVAPSTEQTVASIEEVTSKVVLTTEATVASSTEQTTEQQTTEVTVASSEEITTEAPKATEGPSASSEAQNTESVVAPSGEVQSEANTKASGNEFQSMLTKNQEFLEDKYKLTSDSSQITPDFQVPVTLTGNVLEMSTLPFTTSPKPQPPYKLDNDVMLTPTDQIKFEETTESQVSTTRNLEAEKADESTVTHVPTDIYDFHSSTNALMEDEAFTTLSIDNDIDEVDEDEALGKFGGMHLGKKPQGSSVPHKSQYLSTEAGDTESSEEEEPLAIATAKIDVTKHPTKHRKHHWHFGKKKTTVDDENEDAFTVDELSVLDDENNTSIQSSKHGSHVTATPVPSDHKGSTLGVHQSPTIEDTNVKSSGATLSEEDTTEATAGQTVSEAETEGSKLSETVEESKGTTVTEASETAGSSVGSETSSATEETVEESKATAETKESQPETGTTSETEITTGVSSAIEITSSQITVPGGPNQPVIGETSPNGREYVEGYVSNSGFKYYDSGNGKFSIANAETTETTERTVDMISAIDDALKIFTGSTEPPKGMPQIVNETFVSAKANQHQYGYPVTTAHHTNVVSSSGMADLEKSSPKMATLESTSPHTAVGGLGQHQSSPVSTLSQSISHGKVSSLNAENLDYDTNNDAGSTDHNRMPTKHKMGITITYENGRELLKLTEEVLTVVGTFEHHRTRKPKKHKWFGGKSTGPSTYRVFGPTFTSPDEEEIATTREPDITETIPATSVSLDNGADGDHSKIISAGGTTLSGENVSKHNYGTTVSNEFHGEKEFTGKTVHGEHEHENKADEGQGGLTTETNHGFGGKNTQSGNIESKLSESKESHLTTSDRYVTNDHVEHTTHADEVQTQSEESQSKNVMIDNMSGQHDITESEKNTQTIISIKIDTNEEQETVSTSQQSIPDTHTLEDTHGKSGSVGVEVVSTTSTESNQKLPDTSSVASEQKEVTTSASKTTGQVPQNPSDVECVECKTNETIPTEAEEFFSTTKSNKSSSKSDEDKSSTKTSSNVGNEVPSQVSTSQQNIPATQLAAPTTHKASDVGIGKSDEDMGHTTAASLLLHKEPSASGMSYTTPSNVNNITPHTQNIDTVLQSSLNNLNQEVPTTINAENIADIGSTVESSTIPSGVASTESNAGLEVTEMITTTLSSTEHILGSSEVFSSQGTLAYSSQESFLTSNKNFNLIVNNTDTHQLHIITMTGSTTIGLGGGVGHSEFPADNKTPSGAGNNESTAAGSAGGGEHTETPSGDKTETVLGSAVSNVQEHISNETNVTIFPTTQKEEESVLSDGGNHDLGDDLMAETSTEETTKTTHEAGAESTHGGTEKAEYGHGSKPTNELITTTSHEGADTGSHVGGSTPSEQSSEASLSHGTVAYSSQESTLPPNKNFNLIVNDTNTHQLHIITMTDSTTIGLGGGVGHSEFLSDNKTPSGASNNESTAAGSAGGGGQTEIPSSDRTETVLGSTVSNVQEHISNETNVTIFPTTQKEEESVLSDGGNHDLGDDLMAETSTEDTTKATHEAGAESAHSGSENAEDGHGSNTTSLLTTTVSHEKDEKELSSSSHGQGVGVSSSVESSLHVETSTSSENTSNKNFNLIVNNTDTHQLHIISMSGATTTGLAGVSISNEQSTESHGINAPYDSQSTSQSQSDYAASANNIGGTSEVIPSISEKAIEAQTSALTNVESSQTVTEATAGSISANIEESTPVSELRTELIGHTSNDLESSQTGPILTTQGGALMGHPSTENIIGSVEEYTKEAVESSNLQIVHLPGMIPEVTTPLDEISVNNTPRIILLGLGSPSSKDTLMQDIFVLTESPSGKPTDLLQVFEGKPAPIEEGMNKSGTDENATKMSLENLAKMVETLSHAIVELSTSPETGQEVGVTSGVTETSHTATSLSTGTVTSEAHPSSSPMSSASESSASTHSPMSSALESSASTQHAGATTNGTKSLKNAWNKMINKVKQIGHANHSTTASTSAHGTSVPVTSTQVSLKIDSHTQLIASVNAIVIDESKIDTSPTPTIFLEASDSGSTKQMEATVAVETATSSETTNKEDKHVTLPGEHIDASAGSTEPQQLIGTLLQSPGPVTLPGEEHIATSSDTEFSSSSTPGGHSDHTTSETSSGHHTEHIEHIKGEDTNPTQVGQSTEHSTQGVTSPNQPGRTDAGPTGSPSQEHGQYGEHASTPTNAEASEHVGTTYSTSPSPVQSTPETKESIKTSESVNHTSTSSTNFNIDVALEESSNLLKNNTNFAPVIILHTTISGMIAGGTMPAMPVNIKLLLEEANKQNQTQDQSTEKGLGHSDITTLGTTLSAVKEGQSFSQESTLTGQDHGTSITGASATTPTSTLYEHHESKAEELQASTGGSTASSLGATTVSLESSTSPLESPTEKTSSLRPEDSSSTLATSVSYETTKSPPISSSGETSPSPANIKSEAATNPAPTVEKHVLTTLVNPPILHEEHQDLNMHHLSTKAEVATLKQDIEHSSTEFGGVDKNKITSAPGEHKEQTLEPAKQVSEHISETESPSSSTTMESTTLEDMHTTEEINYVTNARSHASEIISTLSSDLTIEHELGTTSTANEDLAATSHSTTVDLDLNKETGVSGDHTELTLGVTSHIESSLSPITESETSSEHSEQTFEPAKQAPHSEDHVSSSSEALEGVGNLSTPHESETTLNDKNTNTPGEHSESTHSGAEMTVHTDSSAESNGGVTELTTKHEPTATAPGEHSEQTLEPAQHSPQAEMTEHSKDNQSISHHGTPKVLFSTSPPEIIYEEHQNLNMHHFSHTSSTSAPPTTISEETETSTASEHPKTSKKHKHLFKHKTTTSLTTDNATSTSTTEAFYIVGNETCKYTPVDKSKNFNMTTTTTRTTKPVYINLPTYFLNSTWPVPQFELYYPTHPEEATEIDESFDRTLNPYAYRSMKFADFINITEFPTSAQAHDRLNVSAFKDIPISTTTTEITTEMTTVPTSEATTTTTTTTTTESTTTILTTTESSTESTEILTTTTSEATTTATTESTTTILTTTESSTESTEILTTTTSEATTTTSEATTTTESTTHSTATTQPSTEPTTILTTTSLPAPTTSEATTTSKPTSPPAQTSAVTIANVVPTCNGNSGADKAKTCNLDKDKNSCICSVDSMVKDLQEKSRDSNISAVLSSMCEIYIPLNASGIKVGRCVNRRLRRSFDEYDWDSLESSKPKREVIASADIKDALDKDVQLDESESHKFVTPGSQVRLICADGKNFTSKNYNIKWTVGKDTPLTGAKTLETETGDLIIQNVEPSDGGNYTCSVANHQVGMRTFQHKLSVVTLPTMDINTTILYEVSVDCLKEDEELLRVYFNTAIGNMLCGKEHRVCSIDIVNCTCINKQKKYLSATLVFHMEEMHVIVPTLNTTQCNVACQMKIYAKLVSVIVNNILVFETQPIIYKHSRDVMLTPSKDASLASYEITDSPKLIIACSAGYGLLGDKHICSACEKNTYNNGGQARCMPCPPHQFQPYSGSRSCIKCTSPFQDPACMNMMMLNVNRFKYYALTGLAVLVFVVLCIICIRTRKSKKHNKRRTVKMKPSRTHYDVEMQAVETHDKETITLSNKPSSTKRRRRVPVKARAPPIPVQRQAGVNRAPQTIASLMMTNCADRRMPPTPPTPDFD